MENARLSLQLKTGGRPGLIALLIARALPGDALVVHPQFTEPEAALRAAGRDPRRHLLRPDTGFRLVPSQVPAADLIIHGDPRGLAEKHGGLFAEVEHD